MKISLTKDEILAILDDAALISYGDYYGDQKYTKNTLPKNNILL